MTDIAAISDAEWDVIKIIWARSPVTSGQVVAALQDSKHWRPRTIKTLLARLVKKGAVKVSIEDKRHLYRAVLTRQSAARSEAKSFLARVFDGALLPAVVTFLKESDLSQEDVRKLKTILDGEENQ